MPDYYIRTPDQNESRGPFDTMKLQTLGEAGQLTENSLYYDEAKEEWVPIALNKELCDEVFPKRESLKLQILKTENKTDQADTPNDPPGPSVPEMLDAADGNTEQKKSIRLKRNSMNRSATIAPPAVGLMLMASAIFLLYPHLVVFQTIVDQSSYASLLNYPFVMLGFFDLILGVILFLSVTEVLPLARMRGMLTLGFGVYVGWAMRDPTLMIVSATAGIGMFLTTFSKHLSLTMLAVFLGVASNGYLAYLSYTGRFADFFENTVIQVIAN